MAKQISQETFDTVVKENMDDFDMTAEDAIQDAVSQFEAQGVNLGNIVKDLSLQDKNTTGEHPIITAIKSLSAALEASALDKNAVEMSCNGIKAECDIDLAHRCLAGKNNAYSTLMLALERCSESRNVVLEALCSLCNGQPDLLEDSGRAQILALLQAEADTALILLVVRFIRFTCIKHETNRRAYVGDELIQILADTLNRYRTNADVVKETCSALRVLTFDDDVRVPFGAAHDHAKMIVTKGGVLRTIMEMCSDYINERSVLGVLFATIACLAVRNEFCQEILDLGGLQLMLQTLDTNMDHPGITKQVLGVLKAVAGNDQVKIAIINHGGAELILTAMSKHALQTGICELGCGALGAIVLRNPGHCKRVMSNGGAEVLVKVLQIHTKEAMVQKQACMAIRNVVARTREHCDAFLELGVEPLIQNTYSTHTSCHDEAKAALRDLGCKVHLKELWTGEGHGISH